MRGELGCRWCSAVGRSRSAVVPRVLCAWQSGMCMLCTTPTASHTRTAVSTLHFLPLSPFPLFLGRVSAEVCFGKTRPRHAKVHNNRGNGGNFISRSYDKSRQFRLKLSNSSRARGRACRATEFSAFTTPARHSRPSN